MNHRPTLIVLLSLLLSACGGQAAAPAATSAPTATPAATSAPTVALATSAPTVALATSAPAATTAPTAMPTTSAGKDTLAVVAGTFAYGKGDLGITPSDPFRVEVQGIDGDYARVVLIPGAKVQRDPPTVFLKRAGAAWQGLTYGTAFDPDPLKEQNIPPGLWMNDPGTLLTDSAAPQDSNGTLGTVTQAVINAALAYGTKEIGITAQELYTVEIEGIDGGWARVRLEPGAGVQRDPSVVFLKFTGTTWAGSTYGTAFDNDQLKQMGVPQTLWRNGA